MCYTLYLVHGIYQNHTNVYVQSGSETIIKFRCHYGCRSSHQEHQIIIKLLPESGLLYQLSSTYSKYGYGNVKGKPILQGDAITDTQNRMLYTRPIHDYQYHLSSFGKIHAYTGGIQTETIITLLHPDGNIIGSDFLLGNEGWYIVGNYRQNKVLFEPYSRGVALNRYIFGKDDHINVGRTHISDLSLWYFEAPAKYLGSKESLYGGHITFAISAFGGDFHNMNSDETRMVILETKHGYQIGYPIKQSHIDSTALFKQIFSIGVPVNENVGWVDKYNNIVSKTDIMYVLSDLRRFAILGDWTTGREVIAIDNVFFVHHNKDCSQ